MYAARNGCCKAASTRAYAAARRRSRRLWRPPPATGAPALPPKLCLADRHTVLVAVWPAAVCACSRAWRAQMLSALAAAVLLPSMRASWQLMLASTGACADDAGRQQAGAARV